MSGESLPAGYVDANVVLAYLAGPSHRFHAEALGIMQQVDQGRRRIILTPIIVAQIIWGARRILGMRHADAANAVRLLLDAPGVDATEARTVHAMLSLIAERPSLDAANAYLVARARDVGPPVIVSYDRDLDGIAGIEHFGA